MDAPRRSGNGGDMCLYGSVVGMDALLRADADASGDRGGGASSSPVSCDECDEQRARVECADCGLAYCASCDAHRHRKGKLLFHQRTPILTIAAGSAGPLSVVPLAAPPQPQQQQDDRVLLWSVDQVSVWLRDHDLELFVAEILAHSINGAFLLSSRIEEFLETHSSASRSHKKKLLREIQKLKAEQSDGSGGFNSNSKQTMLSTPMKNVMMVSASTELQTVQSQQLQPRRLGMNLRVNVNTSPASASASAAPLSSSSTSSEPNFSPVTSLRSRIVHGQADEQLRGRINRRRSMLSPTSSASSTPEKSKSNASLLSINPVDEPKRKSSNALFAPSQLRIDVAEHALLTSAVSASVSRGDNQFQPQQMGQSQAPRLETRPTGRTDLRANRQALVGGLDLDIMQVKKEERSVEASFDFSAEGRLQTQGFEINVRAFI